MHQYYLALLFAILLLSINLPTSAEGEIISLERGDTALNPQQLYTKQPSVTPSLAIAGELTVGVKTKEIDGPNLLENPTGRRLKLEIWYPAKTNSNKSNANARIDRATYSDVTRAKKAFTIQGNALREAPSLTNGQRYPLVVLSHGYTGYRALMFYLGEHLASHGYVVASIDHTDSTNKEVDFQVNPTGGFKSTLLHRSRDQQATLDYLTKHASDFGGNPGIASVIGYSMGGFGALNTVGACHTFPDSIAGRFALDPVKDAAIIKLLNNCNAGRDATDPRWKAMVALAPWGGEMGVITQLEDINVPSLLIAGEDDDISGYENGVKKLFKQITAPHSYMMVYQAARHNIAPHPAPATAYSDDLSLGHYFEAAWSSEVLNRFNQHMILAFLNCHIKDTEEACRMLPAREDITQTKQADGTLNAPWPGFKDRFGTGVKFYRGKGS